MKKYYAMCKRSAYIVSAVLTMNCTNSLILPSQQREVSKAGMDAQKIARLLPKELCDL